jgi:hypothetical protein
MKTPDGRSLMLGVLAWLNGDRSDQNSERVADYVVAKAIAGRFAFFKLVIDLVDGKLHQSAEEELTIEANCVVGENAAGLNSKQCASRFPEWREFTVHHAYRERSWRGSPAALQVNALQSRYRRRCS